MLVLCSPWFPPIVFSIVLVAKSIIQGIPHGSRARPILFSSQSLQKKSTAYPSIGQKRLNGAASRMMIHFASELATEIQNNHPCEANRLDHIVELCFWFEAPRANKIIIKMTTRTVPKYLSHQYLWLMMGWSLPHGKVDR